MILKIAMFLVIAFVVNGVSGAAFSKVFVSSGSEVFPVEYVQYGVPSISLGGPQIGLISTGSIEQGIPVPSAPDIVTPCSLPCVYPGQVTSALAPILSTSSNTITYKSSIPVVMPSNEEAPGYEYSYIVSDDNTGDYKSQYELSDGSVIQGEYSLLQPDGYIREVTYIADDARGFNAFVKHYLPETEQTKKDTKEEQPTPEVKNELPEISETNKEKQIQDFNQKLAKLSISFGQNKKDDLKEESDKKDLNNAIQIKTQASETKPTNENSQKGLEIDTTKTLESKTYKADVLDYKQEQPLKETQSNIGPVKNPNTGASLLENKKIPCLQSKEIKNNINIAVPKTETPPQMGLEENDIASYTDIFKCFQAVLNGDGKIPGVPKLESPLTYIILNKLC